MADGLITFYLESKAADYIAALSNQSNYAESPYVVYNTQKRKQLSAPKKNRVNRQSSAGAPVPASSQAESQGLSQGQGQNQAQGQAAKPTQNEVNERSKGSQGSQGSQGKYKCIVINLV